MLLAILSLCMIKPSDYFTQHSSVQQPELGTEPVFRVKSPCLNTYRLHEGKERRPSSSIGHQRIRPMKKAQTPVRRRLNSTLLDANRGPLSATWEMMGVI
ncbi:hypothetical protein K0M31_006872 [Melipona bicolor]|uniref:Uncharacterized protein n=1 Tax=Melipona bicolor TaxID=60889 RepID=A0AA40FSK4_9HYME|nr:hypothetical protein K0M31_006872 [Melipona bicolor]